MFYEFVFLASCKKASNSLLQQCIVPSNASIKLIININMMWCLHQFQRYRPQKQPMLDCLSIVRQNLDDCCHHSQAGYINMVRMSHSIQNQLNTGDPCLKLPRAFLVQRVNFMDRSRCDNDYDDLIEETVLLREGNFDTLLILRMKYFCILYNKCIRIMNACTNVYLVN